MVLLCCLALFDVSQICNHVQSRVAAGFSLFPEPFHQVQVGLSDLCGLGSYGSQCIHDHTYMYMCL